MQTKDIQVLMAQLNPRVGDIARNCQKILNVIQEHHLKFDLIIFPELVLTGYPPEDLFFQPDFISEIEQAIEKIRLFPSQAKLLIGTIRLYDGKLFNSVAFIEQQSVSYYDKRALPNYSVFNESRYFAEGQTPFIQFNIHGHQFGVLICEDIWQKQPVTELLNHPIDSIISINASPYHQGKIQDRLNILKQLKKPVLYVNTVGGQDEIVFDGQSIVINQKGNICARAKAFQEEMLSVCYTHHQWQGSIEAPLEPIAELYEALKLGLSDFMQKNHIQKAVLGLSGGIDSALTLAIAADAVGSNNVEAILMPSPYTAQMSIDDAIAQAQTLGVKHHTIPIESFFNNFTNELSTHWKQDLKGLTSQNLQARIRGVILMAHSNQHQALLLSTSNKSESAVGYCTLYGDMCGGFAVLKDVYKMEVYQLANYVNRHTSIIPERVIVRAPSAELAPNQTDQDELPPYDVLDAILKDIIEYRLSEQALLKKGYSEMLIQQIYRKIKQSEFKRFQAAPGTKVSQVAFGKDWRFPISNQWKF
jgi:NAD+ synthase (glutamine-hydrolysing)